MFDKLHRDPRKVDGRTTTCPQIQKVIAEVKRYENVPHRCEPLDLTMIRHFISHNEFCCQTSLAAALIDWWIVGIHGGFRQSEWCQAQGKATIGHKKVTEQKKKDRPLAFTPDDVEFLTRKKKKLSTDAALEHPQVVWYVRL